MAAPSKLVPHQVAISVIGLAQQVQVAEWLGLAIRARLSWTNGT
jgi:hypothetical protein